MAANIDAGTTHRDTDDDVRASDDRPGGADEEPRTEEIALGTVPAPRAPASGPIPVLRRAPAAPAGHGAYSGPATPSSWYAPPGTDAYRIPADVDVDDPHPAGNPPAAFAFVLGAVALLVGLRPLAFGGMGMAWDTYVALLVAVVALACGVAGLRGVVRRPLAGGGVALAAGAMAVVALLPVL